MKCFNNKITLKHDSPIPTIKLSYLILPSDDHLSIKPLHRSRKPKQECQIQTPGSVRRGELHKEIRGMAIANLAIDSRPKTTVHKLYRVLRLHFTELLSIDKAPRNRHGGRSGLGNGDLIGVDGGWIKRRGRV